VQPVWQPAPVTPPARPPGRPAARRRSILADSQQLTRLTVHEYHASHARQGGLSWCDTLSGPGSMHRWGPHLHLLAPKLKELRLQPALPAQQAVEYAAHGPGGRSRLSCCCACRPPAALSALSFSLPVWQSSASTHGRATADVKQQPLPCR